MMTASGRAQAVYNSVVAGNPAMAKLSASEKQAFLASLTSLYGADLSYIVGAAQVNPGTLMAPAGAPVATAGSATAQTGAVTGPVAVTGLGTVS